MYLLGHTNPKFTMSVYQQVMDMADGGIEIIEKLLGGSADDLFLTLAGRAPRRPFSPLMAPSGEKCPPGRGPTMTRRAEMPRFAGASRSG
jgi:hypothetical protein